MRTAASKVAWVGRTASMVFGLALVLALLFGMASMALGANGDFFKVGRDNVASAVSTLTKSGAGPALRLKVDSGPPLAVNKQAKVKNLNADKLDGKNSSVFASKTSEAWHEVGAPGEPGFLSPSWANYGSGYNTAGFYRDSMGRVHLKGLVKWAPSEPGWVLAGGDCGTAALFRLPAGYRPAATELHSVMRNNTLSRIHVLSNGNVALCESRDTYEGIWYSLDGISFRATN